MKSLKDKSFLRWTNPFSYSDKVVFWVLETKISFQFLKSWNREILVPLFPRILIKGTVFLFASPRPFFWKLKLLEKVCCFSYCPKNFLESIIFQLMRLSWARIVEVCNFPYIEWMFRKRCWLMLQKWMDLGTIKQFTTRENSRIVEYCLNSYWIYWRADRIVNRTKVETTKVAGRITGNCCNNKIATIVKAED